ncbi:hypothetical protein JTE90_005073 [Oedothorax gibbosus]|uniref:Uncharacterized protein n=1 Tax=Oedothorax gibbosus TaxID=931172 RepID=A0AAV6VAS8_9ARAC|nr:hypothetical protein JTE90_005073 [Oedothorax gibbosus]
MSFLNNSKCVKIRIYFNEKLSLKTIGSSKVTPQRKTENTAGVNAATSYATSRNFEKLQLNAGMCCQVFTSVVKAPFCNNQM